MTTKIGAHVELSGMQCIAEAAALVDGCLRKLAGEVEARLVYPLKVGRRPISGLHEEGIAQLFRAIERQAALRQEAMPDHGEAGQQDADHQRSRVTGLLVSQFAHAPEILPGIGAAY